jgi:formylglycine-generating enzyme required for sulfatase activity
VVIAGLAVVVLFFLGAAGLAGAYMLGLFKTAPAKPPTNGVVTPSPSPGVSPVPDVTPEMVAIPGGSFKMGRNDGPREQEKPEHPVTVNSFMMGRYEVTNAEYYEFITEAGYQQIPDDWVNGKPRSGTDKVPVRFVNIDDVNAFIAWRSKKDGVTYRLPTEEEWEYTARNGSKSNLFPWGDSYNPKCAVMEEPSKLPKSVGTQSCPDDWGVQDLIGNVFEWTSSAPSLYPGNTGKMKTLAEKFQMIRGGSFYQKPTGPQGISSTYRIETLASTRSGELGFRLVRSQ